MTCTVRSWSDAIVGSFYKILRVLGLTSDLRANIVDLPHTYPRGAAIRTLPRRNVLLVGFELRTSWVVVPMAAPHRLEPARTQPSRGRARSSPHSSQLISWSCRNLFVRRGDLSALLQHRPSCWSSYRYPHGDPTLQGSPIEAQASNFPQGFQGCARLWELHPRFL